MPHSVPAASVDVHSVIRAREVSASGEHWSGGVARVAVRVLIRGLRVCGDAQSSGGAAIHVAFEQ